MKKLPTLVPGTELPTKSGGSECCREPIENRVRPQQVQASNGTGSLRKPHHRFVWSSWFTKAFGEFPQT